ncbi:hypothetical protein GLOIN_2v1545594 [Rhizophagus irregularis DAOM 181602=DAOM 197198]|uniref:Uncharacterized protein n=2 Tax=Rhizophagus irregularis TaxID=588596 RepID=A0A2N1NI94_9GLOM|nr:hypothetical protein GLOIN_2v1545594 [Rhizophagus irregularis DAOM 181602=DAOM 197198]PKK73606.1 hypothetical protein RhiirC2_740506 [Rhizophagus irregularis]POG77571.1 hypothetical protein GLOIN_2v1545594 [Rhizophagus irregularis DAOM 181602=DAOM 197198]|eukprot:XP_025184437.1 hypothetical protein GLOIN_2v1545594 [Rhizophagus irregularis DAOM 181602=DAOM 197198]
MPYDISNLSPPSNKVGLIIRIRYPFKQSSMQQTTEIEVFYQISLLQNFCLLRNYYAVVTIQLIL